MSYNTLKKNDKTVEKSFLILNKEKTNVLIFLKKSNRDKIYLKCLHNLSALSHIFFKK